jgi:RNA polymerase sigma-70 factor (ECF subfamily)
MTALSSTPRKGKELTATAQQRLICVALPETSGKPPKEEDALVRASQRGDRQAFARLVERYWDSLYRWLYHLTRNRHTAEDLVQETFLKAFRGLNRFQAGSNFRAWLFRIAHNSYANQRRTAARVRHNLADDIPARQESPEDLAQTRESMAHLARAVSKLPPDFRAAFLLRIEEDLSFRQIADVLNLTEETARWRVFKARQKLLTMLAPQLKTEQS